MISEHSLEAIRRIVGPENLIAGQGASGEFASDATKLLYPPDAVALPGKSEEVAAILRLATKDGFPVVPRGAGSGMSGGAVAIRGGLVLAMNRLNRILQIDEDNLTARVEPGVITAHLQEAVEKVGLFYPPDPASAHISTLGGNVAECAGGLRAVKYGVTKDYVLGLEVVLPTGDRLRTGVQTVKGVAGYDLTRLIVGSEGTLAVITEITLRLVPKPAAKRTMTAFFHDVPSALRAVAAIIRAKILPSILEFMDRQCVECVREEMKMAIPREAGSMLLMEVDGHEATVREEASALREICARVGAITFEAASDEASALRLWEARRRVSPSLYRLRPHKISEDVVVPRSTLADLVSRLEVLSSAYGLPILAFGHAGDGNLHVNIMLDSAHTGEVERAEAVVKAVFREVIALGGTITGEHGIGVTKAPYLGMEISRVGLELMGRIKRAFDPAGILNPGKIFPPEPGASAVSRS
jgi:glycolate oxidase